MGKSIIVLVLFLSLSVAAFAEQPFAQYYGTLNIDNYPIASCRVIEVGNVIYNFQYGYVEQSQDIESGYLKSLNSEDQLRNGLEKYAKEMGYNAILGYRFDVQGGFDGYEGSLKNGMLGLGVYRVVVHGTPVKIICGK